MTSLNSQETQIPLENTFSQILNQAQALEERNKHKYNAANSTEYRRFLINSIKNDCLPENFYFTTLCNLPEINAQIGHDLANQTLSQIGTISEFYYKGGVFVSTSTPPTAKNISEKTAIISNEIITRQEILDIIPENASLNAKIAIITNYLDYRQEKNQVETLIQHLSQLTSNQEIFYQTNISKYFQGINYQKFNQECTQDSNFVFKNILSNYCAPQSEDSTIINEVRQAIFSHELPDQKYPDYFNFYPEKPSIVDLEFEFFNKDSDGPTIDAESVINNSTDSRKRLEELTSLQEEISENNLTRIHHLLKQQGTVNEILNQIDIQNLSQLNQTEKQKLLEVYHHLISADVLLRDPMTGFINNQEELNRQVDREIESGNQDIFYFSGDIGFLAAISRLEGRRSGDAVIVYSAQAIEAAAKEFPDLETTLGRPGGDEFAIIIRGDKKLAEQFTKRIQQHITKERILAPQHLTPEAKIILDNYTTELADAREIVKELVSQGIEVTDTNRTPLTREALIRYSDNLASEMKTVTRIIFLNDLYLKIRSQNIASSPNSRVWTIFRNMFSYSVKSLGMDPQQASLENFITDILEKYHIENEFDLESAIKKTASSFRRS